MKLLAIDDDTSNLELVREALENEEIEIHLDSDPRSGMQQVRQLRPRIVLLDLIMPGVTGMDLLEEILEFDPGIDVILMTGNYSTASAVEAIQKGACDYFPKPLVIKTLRQRVGQLIEDEKRRKQGLRLENDLAENLGFEGMIGRSPLMLELFSKIRRIAPHFDVVLITGETGVGKDLVASALHRLCPASKSPFVALNCSSIAEGLAESELFGHVRGAFTGAIQDKVGLFEYANGGTALLDEIGDMPLSMQAKLLRVLQNHEFQRVGSPVVRQSCVRIVAATNRDLAELIVQGKFRQDLYFRLGMIELKVPSLADRREDLPLLQQHFVKQFAARFNKPVTGLTRRAQSLLMRYSWPGNVRELENVIGHAAMMTDSEVIDIRDLPDTLRSQPATSHSSSDALLPLAEMEQLHVQRVLGHANGNKVRAAEILGISRTQLYRIIRGIREEQQEQDTLDTGAIAQQER
jgi:DNA-binding NtrC family response regulator